MTKYVLLAIAVFVVFAWVTGLILVPKKAVYRCDMAEFHPDYSPKIKLLCRELRGKE